MAGERTIFNMTAWLGADISDFQKKMTDAKKHNALFKDSLSDLKRELIGAFSVAAITTFFSTAFKSMAEYQKREEMLLAATKNRKNVQQELINQADEISRNLMFGKGEVEDAQIYAASLGLTTKQIKDLISASVQLSSVTGIGLLETTKQLAKTYGGYAGELGESMPLIKQLTREQLLHGEAVKTVLNNYKGIAEAGANSPAGAIKKLQNAWEEFKVAAAPNVSEHLTAWSQFFNIMSSDKLSGWEKFASIFKGLGGTEGYAKMYAEYDALMKQRSDIEASWAGQETKSDRVASYRASVDALNADPKKNPRVLTTDELKKKLEEAKAAQDALKKSWDEFWNGKKEDQTNWPLAKFKGMFGETNTVADMLGGIKPGPTSGLYDSSYAGLENNMTQAYLNGSDMLSPIKGVDFSGIDQTAQVMSQTTEKLRGGLSTMKSSLKVSLQDINAAINNELSRLVGMVGETLGSLFSGEIPSPRAFFGPLLKELGSFAISFGTLLVAWGAGWVDFFTAPTDPAAAAAAIPAGIALIGIGAALTALGAVVSKGMGSSGSSASSYIASMAPKGYSIPQAPRFVPDNGQSDKGFSVTTKVSGSDLALIVSRGTNKRFGG